MRGLSLLVAVLWFATLSLRPLFNTDEGRYAEIPREMPSGGDWIIPHLNGLAYIEKPPLQYWATALVLAPVRRDGIRGALLHRLVRARHRARGVAAGEAAMGAGGGMAGGGRARQHAAVSGAWDSS